jgi:hypothetical protein
VQLVVPSIPDSAARARSLSNSTQTYFGPRRPYTPNYVACSDVHDHLRFDPVRPTLTASDPAALAYGLSEANQTHPQSRQALLRSSKFHGDVHNCAQHLSPPFTYSTPLETVMGLFPKLHIFSTLTLHLRWTLSSKEYPVLRDWWVSQSADSTRQQ